MENMIAQPTLSVGQKYACLALHVANLDGSLPRSITMAPNVWASRSLPLEIPKHWQKWLGSLESDRLKQANLFLIATGVSRSLEILDDENMVLTERVRRHFYGLLIASLGIRIDHARMMTGAVERQEVTIRQTQEYPPILNLACIPQGWTIGSPQLSHSRAIAEGIAAAWGEGDRGRLWRMLDAFNTALHSRDIGVRCHQHVRCVEGIILPPMGKSKESFKERGAVLTGDRAHFAPLLDDLYAIRGKLEHLHGAREAIRTAFAKKPLREKSLIATDAGETREMLRYTLFAETMAHACLAQVLERPEFRKHLEADSSLEAFWAADSAAQQADWGAAIGPVVRRALKAFDADRLEYAMQDHAADERVSSRTQTRELALRATGEISSE